MAVIIPETERGGRDWSEGFQGRGAGCSRLDVLIGASGTCTCGSPRALFLTHSEVYSRGGSADGSWERKDRALFLDAGAQAQVKTLLAVIPLR